MKRRLGIALVLVLPLAACMTTGPVPPGPTTAPPPSALGLSSSALSWDQLGEIESWLDGPGPGHYPESRAEAELALAEGRLSYAKRDVNRLPAATVGRRVAAAEAGFRRVLSDPVASALERHRAKGGLEGARAMRAQPAPVRTKKATGVRPRSSWGARAAVASRLTPQASSYRRLTVHHSAPPAPLAAGASEAVVADEIRRLQRYHMDQVTPRCGDIGYHFLIDPRGNVYEGRSLIWQGAHSGGTNNVNNIGVCMLGDFRNSLPTDAALASLESLLDDLRRQYGISKDERHVYGHQELKATVCPGAALMNWVKRYRQ